MNRRKFMQIKRRTTKTRIFALLLVLLMLLSTGTTAFAGGGGQRSQVETEASVPDDVNHDSAPSLWDRVTALFGRSDEDDALEPLNELEAESSDEVYGEEMSIFALSDEGVLPVDMDADSFILDPIIERHIRENYDPAFTSLDNMMPVSAMYVKNLIVDEGLRGDMTTFVEIMTDVFLHPELIITQTVGVVPVYVLSEDSDYYVAFINTMIGDSGIQTFDYAFAILNTEGEVVEGYYDFNTGIAYIPRHLFYDEDGIVVLFEIQAQLLQSQLLAHSRSGEMLPMSSAYFVMDEAEEEDVAQVETSNIFSFETRIEIEPGLDPAEFSLVVNGLVVPSSAYEYDPDTGIITLAKSSGSIFSIQVIYEEASEGEYHSIVPQNIYTMPTLGRIALLSGATVGSSGRFDTAFRFQHAPARPNLNIAMYPNYTVADLTRLVNDIMNNNVNMGQLRVANMNVIQAVILYLEQNRSYGNLFRVTEAPHLFWGVNFIQVPLICADIPTPLGTRLPSVNPGTFNQNPGIDVFARVLYLTNDYVLMGFTSQRINAQAGVAVVRLRRDTPPPAPPGLEIIKTSETGRIAGVQFRVTGPNGFHHEVTTGASGRITVPGVTPGVFTVTEINIPAGYEPQAPQTVTLVAGQTAEVRFNNRRVPDEPPGSGLRIIKTSDTGRIAGVRFQVTGPGGFSQIVTTGPNGMVDILDLEPGSYTVTEIDIPPGYAPQAPITRTIMPNEFMTFRFHNTTSSGDLRIIKTSESGVVVGIQFRVTGPGLPAQGQLVTTGSGGVLNLPDMQAGTFTVTEIPRGPEYHPQSPQIVTVRPNETAEVTFHNRLRLPRLELIKTSESGNISGIRFNITGPGLPATGRDVTTNAQGRISVTDLQPGFFMIEEVGLGPDYVPQPPQGVSLEFGSVAEIRFHNELMPGELNIRKTSESGRIVGIPFRVTGPNGFDRTVISGPGGVILIPELRPGTYVVTEMGLGPEYVPQPPQTVVIRPNVTSEVHFDNVWLRGDVEGLKVGEDDDPFADSAGLEGALIGLFRPNETTFITATALETTTTDATGHFAFRCLLYGHYLVREIAPPTGYILNETAFPVYINTDGQVIEIHLENELLRGDVQGIKRGENTEGWLTGVFEDADGLIGATIGLFWATVTEFTEETAIRTVVTDERGFFEFTELVYGHYIVREIAPPTGYVLNDTAFPVYISRDGQVIEVDIQNTLIRGRVEGIKTGEDCELTGAFNDSTGLEGALIGLFGLADVEFVLIGVEPDEPDDEPTDNGLDDQGENDEYAEVNPYDEYGDQDENGEYENGEEEEPEPQEPELEMVVHSIAGIPFEDFEFDTYHAVQTTMTVQDGSFVFEDVIFGTYLVREITPPTGYILNDVLFLVTVTEDGQVIRVEIDNTLLRGRIEGIKVGEDSDSVAEGVFTDSAGLEGAVIGLFGLADIERLGSDTNGPSEDDSEEEVAAPEDDVEDISLLQRVVSWFARDNGEYEDDEYENGETDENGDLPEDDETDDEVDNRDRPIDAIVHAIAGVSLEEFAFTRETALLYEITDENGAFAFENLVYGVYIVREIAPPTGYVLNDTLFVVEVTRDGQVILVELENRLIRGDIPGHKTGEDTEGPLEGFYMDAVGLAGSKFGLFNMVTMTAPVVLPELPVDVLDENDEDNDNGDYADPETYDADNGQDEPDQGENGDYENGVSEEPETELPELWINGIPLADFEFTEENAAYIVVTEDDGLFSFYNLPYGSYIVREISAPTGYLLNETVFLVTISEDGQMTQVDIDNTLLRGRIEGIKIGEHSDSVAEGVFTDSAGLEGAVIGLFGLAELEWMEPEPDESEGDDDESSGNTVDALVRSIGGIPLDQFEFSRETALMYDVTDENGAFAFEDLVCGIYVVREIEAPAGYILNEQLFVVEIREDGQVVRVEIDNALLRGHIEGIKVGEDTESPFEGVYTDAESLEGALIGLFGMVRMAEQADNEAQPEDDSTSNIVSINGVPLRDFEFTEETAAYAMRTGADGRFWFRNLPLGIYVVREIAPPEGYVLNEELFVVEIRADGQAVRVEVDNRLIRGSVEGIKLSADTEEPLEGATFGLFRPGEAAFTRENALMIATSDEDGTFAFEYLIIGAYIVREIQAPDGYVLSDESFEVEITEDGQVVEIEAENRPVRGTVGGLKVSAGTRQPLAGAVFGLFQPDATTFTRENALMVDTSGSDGRFAFVDLAIGVYIVREIQAPAGYLLNSESFRVEVREYGQVIELRVENRPDPEHPNNRPDDPDRDAPKTGDDVIWPWVLAAFSTLGLGGIGSVWGVRYVRRKRGL